MIEKCEFKVYVALLFLKNKKIDNKKQRIDKSANTLLDMHTPLLSLNLVTAQIWVNC